MTKLAVREDLTTRGLASLRLIACMVIPKIITHTCIFFWKQKKHAGCIKNVDPLEFRVATIYCFSLCRMFKFECFNSLPNKQYNVTKLELRIFMHAF